MASKRCCINNCSSCSTREEDIGVTYHKYPKSEHQKEIWIKVTGFVSAEPNVTPYVCSRHFRKTDFQCYEDSKYILKSDAVPSIFPWKTLIKEQPELKMESDESKSTFDGDLSGGGEIALNDASESDGENIEAIKKLIEEQEKEISVLEAEVKPSTSRVIDNGVVQNLNSTDELIDVVNVSNANKNDDSGITDDSNPNETMLVESNVMHIILSESEAKLTKKKACLTLLKETGAVNKAVTSGKSVSLSLGSRVEVKDFSGQWHLAEIAEVDYDEMEVLVRYPDATKKHDEWVSVSSPRLRPQSTTAAESPAISEPKVSEVPIQTVKEEPKLEEKPKVEFQEGERCLARWRDNRRFMATVHADLGNGQYEVVFDDGVHWKCAASRLCKMKDPEGESLLHSPYPYIPSPVQTVGPTATPSPPYHTHLFDPSRDYLGSKSDRRERKRKLNIKEIFNIGQKKKKEASDAPKEKVKKKAKPKKKVVVKTEVKTEDESELSEAMATVLDTQLGSLLGPKLEDIKLEIETVDPKLKLMDEPTENADSVEAMSLNVSTDCYVDMTAAADNLEMPVKKKDSETLPQTETKSEEAIDKIKESIDKLEGDLMKAASPIPVPIDNTEPKVDTPQDDKDKKKNISKMKKVKRLRLLQEKKVKREVEKVKSELEAMKTQLEEMKKQVGLKTEELYKRPAEGSNLMTPESFLLPGEWCCKWINGQPAGTVSEIVCDTKDSSGKPGLPRRSVQVEDKRLPSGWTKHMVRRSLGHSAGKWDVVLVSPDNRRLHTKTDMRQYLEAHNDPSLEEYENVLLDFGVHRKLSRRLGWDIMVEGDALPPLPAGTLSMTSPIVKRKKLSLKKKGDTDKPSRSNPKKKKKKMNINDFVSEFSPPQQCMTPDPHSETVYDNLEDGYVYVGSLKVQVIDTLLRCPKEGCFKNFRNKTLLQMHIKHYHREMRKMITRTPKVSDLASARALPTSIDTTELKVPKLKINKKRLLEEPKLEYDVLGVEVTSPTQANEKPKALDSPKLRNALIAKPVKRPKVLLPVRRLQEEFEEQVQEELVTEEMELVNEETDFEMAISTHLVTKAKPREKKKGERGEKKQKKKKFAQISTFNTQSDEDEAEWCADVAGSDAEGGYGSPAGEPPADPRYVYTDSGERVKIVHMKREEIINCHCGVREEDGLMIQCELCLCWQHALCHNIQREAEVPEKYTCSICLNPLRGRRSRRYIHDQDRLYDGLLANGQPLDGLRRAHELSGNLLKIQDALHALRVQYQVATVKNHPKLYLWAEDWYNGDGPNNFADLGDIISDIGKENLPLRADDGALSLSGMRTPPSEDLDIDRLNQRDVNQLGSQSLLSGLLSSPGGNSLDLPISASELERFAKSVQDIPAPVPEPAIEWSVCRRRLLRHLRAAQHRVDARLDSIEAQVAELESQDPSFEDDETADYFPRTKQTIQMLLRDLETMEELGVIT